ncbi:hypothetical protein HPB50_008590 [Hyalomma asiaticum]|uniref:Uncharacterized protein n=1 Tax=Hyalomma asiaticum TaxID=266040 RepID=A0ACB7SWE7_HYAAI|nr:hypothetical protein HPB50_008590 [Hyalomma asiaticum]
MASPRNVVARAALSVAVLLVHSCWQPVESVSLDRYLQDPLPVPDFNISTRSSLVTVRGRFWDLQLHGLSATRLERATANLTGQTVELATRTELVSLRGQYVLSGDFAFVSLHGNESTMSEMELVCVPSSWQAEQSLRGEIEENVRRRVNEELSRVPVNLTAARSERLVDALLERTAEQLLLVDPYSLPDQARSFDQDLLVLRAQGEMRLEEGSLHGLSTIRRTGDVLAFYQV